MDDLLNVSGGQNTALVILAFLQADCSNVEYNKELFALGTGLNLTRDINCNGPRIDTLEDGDIETDGHPISSISNSLSDIHPVVDLQWPRNHEAAAVPQQVAEELREIADQLERSVVAQATRNLRGNISSSLCEQWNNYLSHEVEWVMRHITVPQHLPQEQVIMALTLTLVKGVCQQAPRFLKNLFNTALQYIILRSAR